MCTHLLKGDVVAQTVIINAKAWGLCRVGTILFTALGISVAAIALHGCMRVPDDLFTDEAEVSQNLICWP